MTARSIYCRITSAMLAVWLTSSVLTSRILPQAFAVGETCNGLAATIVGTTGNDTITGTTGNDVIVALGGNDVLLLNNGGSDKDTVCAGDGDDVVVSSNGDAWIDGGNGNDRITTANGKDTVYGGAGYDSISTGNGNDTIDGGTETDYCNSGSGGGDSVVNCEASSTNGVAVIVKDAVPNDAQDFAFLGNLGSFSLDDDSDGVLSNTLSSVRAPGSYSVVELSSTGWSLTSLVCTDPDGGTIAVLGSATAVLDIDATEVVVCTFTNTIIPASSSSSSSMSSSSSVSSSSSSVSSEESSSSVISSSSSSSSSEISSSSSNSSEESSSSSSSAFSSISSEISSSSSSSEESSSSSSSVSSSSSSEVSSSSSSSEEGSSSSIGNAAESQTVTGAGQSGNGGNGSFRGHRSNQLDGLMGFLGSVYGIRTDGDLPPGAFGGDGTLPDAELQYVCSVQRALSQQILRNLKGALPYILPASFADMIDMLRDPSLCEDINASYAPKSAVVSVQPRSVEFPVSADGFPVSTNKTWNACIRGRVSIDDVRSNTDRDENGYPRDCGWYHTGSLWMHPDYLIFFTFDRRERTLALPVGYTAVPRNGNVTVHAHDQGI